MPGPAILSDEAQGPAAGAGKGGIVEVGDKVMGADGARIGASQQGQGPIKGLGGEMQHQMANAAALIFRNHIKRRRGNAGAEGKQRDPQQHKPHGAAPPRSR